jgi:hypothetical protein
MVGTIICEVGTIICDIGTINVRFYLLEVQYPHGYCRITPISHFTIELVKDLIVDAITAK